MKTRVVVLAGGHGKRMRSYIPKPLVLLNGKPLVRFVLDAVDKSGVDLTPVIVVGVKAEMVKEALGPSYEYAYQAEQLGTGHALRCTESALRGQADAIIVLYGDQPFMTPESIKKIRDVHESVDSVITMCTATVPDFDDWRAFFKCFGRIVRDDSGRVVKIVEATDASKEELAIREVNPAYFCFNADWLWPKLDLLGNDNAQGEYYLTDLVEMAMMAGAKITTIAIDPKEAVGVNTAEHLEIAEKICE